MNGLISPHKIPKRNAREKIPGIPFNMQNISIYLATFLLPITYTPLVRMSFIF